jgi:hypothetical protein
MLKTQSFACLERLINEGTYPDRKCWIICYTFKAVCIILTENWDLKIKNLFTVNRKLMLSSLVEQVTLLIPTFSIQLAALFEFLCYIN